MPDPRKRLNYFTGQFLQEQDFEDEQAYHVDRQRRHNKFLHTSGIADGLNVTGAVGASQVSIAPGTAVDGEGQQIVLTQERAVSLGTGLGKRAFIVISLKEGSSPLPEDQATVGGKGAIRVLEDAVVEAIAINDTNQPIPKDGNNFPERLYTRLALITLNDQGNLAAAPDTTTFFKRAGVNLGDPTVRKITLSRENVPPAQFPALTCEAANQLNVQGNLVIGGTASVGGRPVFHTGGGIITGAVSVRNPALPSIPALPNVPRLDVMTTTTGLLNNTAGAIFAWNRVDPPTAAPTNGACAVIARVTTAANVLPTDRPLPSASLIAISDITGVHGVYATARPGTHALFVEGTGRITGGLSNTHIVDTFINASGQRLKTGDVVKLKGTPAPRFRGQQNKAPVAEVTLADQENDTTVIGIVDCEAVPDPGVPDTRVEPDDPTFIEDGGELYLVTLGVFAHCRVDATEAAIAVGDLLTTSTNPGHAKKATDPKIGAIIGKALDPLDDGVGFISVFVNLQ